MARKKQEEPQAPETTESDFLKKEFAGLSIKQRAALKGWLANLGSVPRACEAAGIHRATWYEWKKNDPDFLRALQLLDEMDADDLEHQANTFARAGDTTLIIFLLKAKRRAKYDDAYARQERAFEKGVQTPESFVPVRAVLVRDEEPPGVNAPAAPIEQEH